MYNGQLSTLLNMADVSPPTLILVLVATSSGLGVAASWTYAFVEIGGCGDWWYMFLLF